MPIGPPNYLPSYLHNLTTILSDNSSGFTPGTLNYSIPNEPATVHDFLMEKSSRAFELAIWGDQISGSNSVTVNLGGSFKTVRIYDPTLRTSPIRTLSNASFRASHVERSCFDRGGSSTITCGDNPAIGEWRTSLRKP